MRPVYATAGTTSSSVSIAVVLDQYLDPTDVLLAVELYGNTSGGSSYTAQYSPDDPYATYATDYNTNANWYATSLNAVGVDSSATLGFPARAVRLATNVVGTGGTQTPRMVVIQAGATG